MHLETLPKSKREAELSGALKYFTGKPCSRGHVSPRNVGGNCIACSASDSESRRLAGYFKERYVREKEAGKFASEEFRSRQVAPTKKRKSSPSRYRTLNETQKDHLRSASKQYRKKCLETDRMLAWCKESIHGAKRRSAKKGIPFNITYEYLRTICVEKCPALGCDLAYVNPGGIVWNTAQLDRIVPSLGYVVGNVRVLSKRANLIKTDATPEEIAKASAYFMNDHSRGMIL